MGVLSSPRRRRRLGWLLALAAVVGAFVLVGVLIPSQGGKTRTVIPRAPAFGDVQTDASTFKSTAAEERAARRSEAAVRPIAQTFVDDLTTRHNVAGAYALLAPGLRAHYSLADWRNGRGLPLNQTGAYGGVSVAFSGATTVGVVADLDQNQLAAVRFQKLSGRWLVDYVREGHGSSYVTSANFAPSGFVPGSRHETVWTWLALVGGLLGLIAIAVIVENRFSPRRSRT